VQDISERLEDISERLEDISERLEDIRWAGEEHRRGVLWKELFRE